MAFRSPLSTPRGPLAALLPGLLACLACTAGGEGAAGVAGRRPNVLFITVDTLRADHLGAYGYGRPTSPAFDSLARSGVVFTSAHASSSWTLPTLASAITGHYSSTHRCWKRKSRLSPAFDTLPELLRNAGYDTACAISHVFLARGYGLQQGFVHFDTSFDRPVAHGDTAVSSPRVTRRAVTFLEHKAASPDRGPWFLWLHYFDPHYRYVAHEGAPAEFGADTPEDRYDGEILFTDEHIGEVLDALAEGGFEDDTIVAFFADHGEEFEDHAGLYHGHTLHAELVRVPFVIRAPGVAPRVVRHPVRTVDLMPTILELVGLDVPPGLAGESLVPSLAGEEQELLAVSELRLLTEEHHYESLVEGSWKLIVAREDGSARLYDLAADPGERHDLAAAEPERVERMRRLLAGRIEAAEREGEAYAPIAELDLSSSEAAQLDGLGYGGDGEEDE